MPIAQSDVPQFVAHSCSSADPRSIERRLPYARPTRNSARGFSVVELLLVVAIILIITVMAIPHLVSALTQARISRAVEEIHAIEVNITIYQSGTNGVLPTDLSQIEATALTDPWGHPYQFFNHISGTGNGGMLRQDLFLVPLNEDYDLYSMGPDGLTAAGIGAAISLDDIVRGGSGAYTGLASQF